VIRSLIALALVKEDAHRDINVLSSSALEMPVKEHRAQESGSSVTNVGLTLRCLMKTLRVVKVYVVSELDVTQQLKN
jgi:hypothetical protein